MFAAAVGAASLGLASTRHLRVFGFAARLLRVLVLAAFEFSNKQTSSGPKQ